MGGPRKFAVDSYSEVLGRVSQGKFDRVDEIVREKRLLFVGDAEGEAFAGVEFHFIRGFPKLEGV